MQALFARMCGLTLITPASTLDLTAPIPYYSLMKLRLHAGITGVRP